MLYFQCDFAEIMLQSTVLLFNTKKSFIPVNFDGSYYASAYNIASKPTVKYGNELGILRTTDKKRLEAAHTRLLRSMYYTGKRNYTYRYSHTVRGTEYK
jgi:hypothetical protein